MYAYILEMWRGLFEGVCTLSDEARISSDRPPPCHSWIALGQYCLRLTRFVPLSAVNVYSLLPNLVLGNKLQSEGNRPSSAPIGAGCAGSCIWASENTPFPTLGEMRRLGSEGEPCLWVIKHYPLSVHLLEYSATLLDHSSTLS